MSGLLAFSFLMFAALLWWRLLKGKELARIAAHLACREHGLLLMDDTVVLDAIEFVGKDKIPQYGLRYRFDFAHQGILLTGGKIWVNPGRPTTVVIPTSQGQLIEQI